MDEKVLKQMTEKDQSLLKDVHMGIEIEGQRTNLNGELAKTNHPFPDKINHPFVTVDFAENQLEFMTEPYQSSQSIIGELVKIRGEVEKKIQNELIWPFSMPPILPDEKDIPIAKFGSSDEAKEKEIYRKGLALRYGKKLQMISGVHFNFSIGHDLLDALSDQKKSGESDQWFKDRLYMRLARRFIDYRWLLIYLFGASPVCHESYDSVIKEELSNLSKQCYDLCHEKENLKKYATSIRLSRFGYPIEMSSQYQVSYRTIQDYIHDLKQILKTESAHYQTLGIYHKDQQVQLNSRLIQNENEFYTPIRFKQSNQKSGESNLEAIERAGVQYVEVRLLDLNPYAPYGITADQIDFLHVFMMLCLFDESIDLTEEELIRASKNHQLVALLGRLPNLQLFSNHHETVTLETWANKLFKKLEKAATFFNDPHYNQVVERYKDRLEKPHLLPSNKIIRDMDQLNMNYIDYGLYLALDHTKRALK
ncbi:glutamate-cysteine ligase [Pelagirhabdus alkalitolerans]|uniref:Glutamate--cysteine ligase n=1 Tax=Pelagirhabdus alkalitolerans TaxID=1612202 RepID=A0A1G6ILP3_9BACI|nr:hypothetical protein [Pelagirhabdus alkalitolerans]SDC07418.1 glutamate-cysteine ligase [Pelagirhabdus alkalitolerans]